MGHYSDQKTGLEITTAPKADKHPDKRFLKPFVIQILR